MPNISEFLEKNRIGLLIFFAGAILLGLGVIYFKGGLTDSSTKVEILSSTTSAAEKEITVEVSGNVEKPGVYNLPMGARIEDALVSAGGISGSADRVWVERNLNRAAKLTDGQKIYIPGVNEQSNVLSAKTSGGYQTTSTISGGQNGTLVNINAASLSELDTLPGIGPVYGQNIIDHRPYSNIEELSTKGVLTKSVYDKIKDLVAIY